MLGHQAAVLCAPAPAHSARRRPPGRSKRGSACPACAGRTRPVQCGHRCRARGARHRSPPERRPGGPFTNTAATASSASMQRTPAVPHCHTASAGAHRGAGRGPAAVRARAPGHAVAARGGGRAGAGRHVRGRAPARRGRCGACTAKGPPQQALPWGQRALLAAALQVGWGGRADAAVRVRQLRPRRRWAPSRRRTRRRRPR
jgi:hypothetical protein